MKQIDSFLKDHDILAPGFYLSNINHDVSTFDLRFKYPNTTYFSTAAAHSIEHMLATTLRNSTNGQNIIYFGPMGCMTGFYLLTYGLDINQAKELMKAGIKQALEFESVPGSQKKQCGNYQSHDLKQAKAELLDYLKVLND